MSNGHQNAIGIVAAILGCAVVVLWIIYGLKRVFKYSLDGSILKVRILGVTVERVPFSDIEYVEIIPFRSLVLFSRSFRPDLFISRKLCGYNKRVVAIKRRTGLVKRIIVSPQDPEGFVSSLKGAAGGFPSSR